MKSESVTIQMKAIEQYFPVVLFIILYKVVQTFEFVNEIVKCDHSNESYWAVLSCGMLHMIVLPFRSVEEILKCDKFVLTFEMKVTVKSVKYDRPGELWSWVGLFVVTLTDVEVVIRVKWIVNLLWSLFWLVDELTLLLVVCQLSRHVNGCEDCKTWLVRFDPSCVRQMSVGLL